MTVKAFSEAQIEALAKIIFDGRSRIPLLYIKQDGGSLIERGASQ